MALKLARQVFIIIIFVTKGMLVVFLYFKVGWSSDNHILDDDGHCPTINEPAAVSLYQTNQRYCLQTKTNKLLAELPFTFSSTTLTDLHFPVKRNLSSPTTATNPSVSHQLVFVTAANCKHFDSAMDAIGRTQKLFPNHTIYFYDLGGLARDDPRKISQLHNVVYREFNFSRYPPHVRQLLTYAFKPLLIHEMLHEYSNIFWLDSSIRFTTSKLLHVDSVQTSTSLHTVDIMLFDNAGSSNFAPTHSGMYRYLPIIKQAAINTTMYGANAIYIHCTQQLYDHVLRWWFLCALEPDCIAPIHDLHCSFRGRDLYAGCHRYDQSALNILLANYFNNDDGSYMSKSSVLTVERRSRHKEKLSVSLPNGNMSFMSSRDYFGNKFFWCIVHQLPWLLVAFVVIVLLAVANVAIVVTFVNQQKQRQLSALPPDLASTTDLDLLLI
jgi:hypothetical protein